MTENITLPRELAEKALEALEHFKLVFGGYSEEVKALRTALAAEQQKPEPVATVGTQSAAWKGYDGRWSPPGDPIKVVHLLRDLPLGTLLYTAPPDAEALRRDAERWQHWRDSHGFATIDHEKGRCFVTLICDCDDPDQVRAKRFRGEDSFEWLDAFTDAAMKEGT